MNINTTIEQIETSGPQIVQESMEQKKVDSVE
jgi:hypothetical protein